MSSDEYWPDVPAEGGLKRLAVRGASVTFVAQAIRFVVTMATQIILARLLMPADFGLIAMVMPVIGIVQVMADLGLTQAIVSRARLLMSELNSFFWLSMCLSLALSGVAMTLAPILAWIYGQPEVVAVTLCSALFIIVAGVGSFQAALLNRQMRYVELAVVEVGALVAGTVAAVVAAMMGMSYWSLIIGMAVTTCTSAAAYWYFSSWRPGRPVLNKEAMSLFKFGGSVTVSNLLGQANQATEKMIVGIGVGQVGLGLYDRSWRLVMLPLHQIQAPFGRVAVPTLARLLEEPERYWEAYRKMVQAMLLCIIPAMIFAGAMAGPLIAFVLGERWLDAVPVFPWLCVQAACMPILWAALWLIISQGRTRDQMIFGAISPIVHIASNAFAIQWGLVAMVAITAGSMWLIQAPLLVWGACRAGPVRLSHFLRLLLPNMLAAAGSLVTLWYLVQSQGGESLLLVVVAGPISLICYAGILACFRASRADLVSFVAARSVFRPVRTA